jgi:NAD(P)-dependent dehydrogenase (short-subunit alcohol dehydrogenase family)
LGVESIEGKTALVTGAAKRLGCATALALASEGAHVALHYGQSADEAEQTAEAVRSHGVRAWTFQADLANTGDVQDLSQRVEAEAGPVDILINSASIFPESDLESFTPEALFDNIRVNTLAPLVLARALHATGRCGTVVNYLDCMIADYDRKHVAYHLSKRMLQDLTRMMAVEFGPNLRVNGVAPGLVLPPVGKDESYLADLASSNPLNAYGCAEDVTAATVFLLQSDFVTGQVVYVDGGRHLRGNMYG